MAHAWKACWVQALGGSNPPSSATGPRDRFRFRGFCCLWRRWCSGRRRARPPARSPHASLRLGVVDLEARPCPPGPLAPVTSAALVVLCALARPRRPRGGLQSGGACRYEWPGSAADRGHCCQALGVPWRASIVRLLPCRAPASFPVKRWGRAERAPGLAPTYLDPEAFDDLRSRERGKDLARHEKLRTPEARADAAPARRAR